jgi:hypothetical protein
MWSEHCSYKNTRPLLKTFPTRSPRVLVGAGEENAGIIDIGDGWPSLSRSSRTIIPARSNRSRARPPAWAASCATSSRWARGRSRPSNSLRFGPAEQSPKCAGCSPGVVAGIAHYGNCFGIPTIAGEVYFDKSYEGNPLVNVFCLGVLRHDQIARGAGRGRRQPGVLCRPAHRSRRARRRSLCLAGFDGGIAEQQRGAVQVGDPFMEKLCAKPASNSWPPALWPASRTWARRGSPARPAKPPPARRHGYRDRVEQGAATRAGHEPLRDHAQRVPGTHAHHRQQAAAKTRSNGSSRSGTCPGPRSAP